MASITIKSTFSLDPATADRLAQLAQAWGVSKSEALRRSIQNTPMTPPASSHPALAAFEALHAQGGRSAASAKRWSRQARKMREAASLRSESKAKRARQA